MKTWRERIAEAEGRRWRAFGLTLWPGHFSADDHAATGRIFSDMNPGKPVCAIGEMRDRYGIELDHAMIALGSDFMRAVVWNNVAEAGRLLDAIEDRALALKREQAR